jgi:hypothetical protein
MSFSRPGISILRSSVSLHRTVWQVQYKIIQSNTSLFCLLLRSGYMFRSQGPSSGLNTNMTLIQIIWVTFEISVVLTIEIVLTTDISKVTQII